MFKILSEEQINKLHRTGKLDRGKLRVLKQPKPAAPPEPLPELVAVRTALDKISDVHKSAVESDTENKSLIDIVAKRIGELERRIEELQSLNLSRNNDIELADSVLAQLTELHKDVKESTEKGNKGVSRIVTSAIKRITELQLESQASTAKITEALSALSKGITDIGKSITEKVIPEFPKPIAVWDFTIERDMDGTISRVRAEAIR